MSTHFCSLDAPLTKLSTAAMAIPRLLERLDTWGDRTKIWSRDTIYLRLDLLLPHLSTETRLSGGKHN